MAEYHQRHSHVSATVATPSEERWRQQLRPHKSQFVVGATNDALQREARADARTHRQAVLHAAAVAARADALTLTLRRAPPGAAPAWMRPELGSPGTPGGDAAQSSARFLAAAAGEAAPHGENSGRCDLSNRSLTSRDAASALLLVCGADGGDQTAAVEAVDLSGNRVARLRYMPPSVVSLNVSRNRLRNLAGLWSLRRLRALDVSHNRIESVWGLAPLAGTLKVLNCAHNRIACVDGLERLRLLSHLDLSNNLLAAADDIRALALNTALVEVRLAGNPIENVGCGAGRGGAARRRDGRGARVSVPMRLDRGLRARVMHLLPGVRVLDGARLSASPHTGPRLEPGDPLTLLRAPPCGFAVANAPARVGGTARRGVKRGGAPPTSPPNSYAAAHHMRRQRASVGAASLEGRRPAKDAAQSCPPASASRKARMTPSHIAPPRQGWVTDHNAALRTKRAVSAARDSQRPRPGSPSPSQHRHGNLLDMVAGQLPIQRKPLLRAAACKRGGIRPSENVGFAARGHTTASPGKSLVVPPAVLLSTGPIGTQAMDMRSPNHANRTSYFSRSPADETAETRSISAHETAPRGDFHNTSYAYPRASTQLSQQRWHASPLDSGYSPKTPKPALATRPALPKRAARQNDAPVVLDHDRAGLSSGMVVGDAVCSDSGGGSTSPLPYADDEQGSCNILRPTRGMTECDGNVSNDDDDVLLGVLSAMIAKKRHSLQSLTDSLR